MNKYFLSLTGSYFSLHADRFEIRKGMTDTHTYVYFYTNDDLISFIDTEYIKSISRYNDDTLSFSDIVFTK